MCGFNISKCLYRFWVVRVCARECACVHTRARVCSLACVLVSVCVRARMCAHLLYIVKN